jgi:putative ABC transport system ATP-binding protein
MITLKQLSKTFRTEVVETKALHEVSLTINQGDFISIMGPSGSGKSTLLNIVGLLDSATAGSYHLFEHQILGLKEQAKAKLRKQNIGFVFQNFNLIDELNVYDNLELPLIYNNVPNNSQRKLKIERIAERLGIAHRLKHFPQQLSGGQQQRVAVARALINDPKIILADEPTGNLDSKNGNEVMELLTDLHANGSTILMVTHSDNDASFSQKIIYMKDGMILSEKLNSRNTDVLTKNKLS